ETQNQEGLALGLLGTMTLLMGSRLGMPSLYNTQTGQAGIGRWGLMDQGSYNFQGLVPAEPSAWEKVYMGWETPVTIRQGEAVRIGSSTTKTAPHIIKVPIDSKEYFLIENRVRDRNGDGITLGRDEYGNRVEFDSTGRVVASAPFGVLTRVDEYDFGLPGEGLLIWHIDERRIEAGLADHTVNNDRDHRGVDLVECDGAQDIGYVYNMFDAGYGTENGDYYDAYWNTNESHKIVNDADHVAFSPWSIPNSNAHNHAVTHIIIDQFSDRDTVMSVRIHSDLSQDGFPLAVDGPFGKAGLLTLDLGQEQGTAIFAASRNGTLWGWQGDGQPLTGKESGLFAALGDSLDQPLAALSPSTSHSACLAAAGRSGHLYLWLQQTGSQWSFTQSALHSRISAGPMLLADETTDARYTIVGLEDGRCVLQPLSSASQEFITLDLHAGAVTGLSQCAENGSTFLLATETGLLACCTPSPSVQWQLQLSHGKDQWQPLTADFTFAPGLEIVVLSAGGEFWMVNNQGQGARLAALPSGLGQPAAGDIDEDGLAEILLTNGKRLFVYEPTGAATLNFPFDLGSPDGEVALSPVWINTTATASWAFAGSTEGLVWGTTRAGRSQPGYPLSAGGGLSTTPVLQDLDRDGDVELLTVGSDQNLNAWSLPLTVQGESWSQWGAGPARTFILKGGQEPMRPGNELMPAKKTFCYPNPSRDNTTLLHYSLTQDAKSVSIRIFDLAGDLVEELAALPARAGDHETAWHLDGVSAGVYIARVEAQGYADTAVTFVKIAVIK
ncbi:T9SS type A sorting domain-containing protein, partial [bacterium]|nr:T9SS type A sorting domain-containing protein [bacterium]